MKSLIKIAVLTLATTGLVLSPHTLAQEALVQPVGDTPIDRLMANCDAIQTNLRRLHTADALMRVNIGQMYNGISVRLMARLNSRLALNRIDSTNEVEITGKFEEQRKVFNTSYSKYEASLSSVMKKNCKTNPAEYYQGLLLAREERDKLAQAVQSMNDSVREYQMTVQQLSQQLFEKDDSQEDPVDE